MSNTLKSHVQERLLVSLILSTLTACQLGAEPTLWYPDADGDGFGADVSPISAVEAPPGTVSQGGDCNDSNATIHPGVTEVCDLQDNNCDGTADEGFTHTWYDDNDGDGFGGTVGTESCSQPTGTVSNADDCDDGDPRTYPQAPEACNGKDDNCNGDLDETYPTKGWYQDADQDGWGSDLSYIVACQPPPGTGIWLNRGGDCNDGDPLINPVADEVCDHVDNDCNEQVDDDAIDQSVWYTDDDGDGFGAPGTEKQVCFPLPSWVPNDEDCNDLDPEVNGYLAERCDGKDNNCNDQIDEDLHPLTFFLDLDGDGFGQSDETVQGCIAPDGYTPRRGDCADDDADTYPGASDANNDGLDQDCGGTEGSDPSMGLASSSAFTLQDLLAAAQAGQTLWIGPGHWFGTGASTNLKLTVASTDLAPTTLFDTEGKGGALFVYSEGKVTLDGLTLTGGGLSQGTGSLVSVEHGTLNLQNAILKDNLNWYQGGAIRASGWSSISRVPTIVNLSNTLIENTTAESGGAIFTDTDVTLTLQNSTIRNCRASRGGALYTYYTRGQLDSSLLYDNFATLAGGAIFASTQAQLEIGQSVLVGNGSQGTGGMAFVSWAGSLSLHDSLVLENSAPQGAAIYLERDQSLLFLSYDILAYNAGEALTVVGEASNSNVVSLFQNGLYAAPGSTVSNLAADDPAWESLNVVAEPDFVYYTPNRDPSDDDFHLQPGSPLRVENIANPPASVYSPDLTGLYSQSDSDGSYYTDADMDGLYDGWESRHGLSVGTADGNLDADADGVQNRDELTAGLLPDQADTDRDGSADGTERAQGSDPLDFYARPGQDYPATARVPGDFPTLQAAIDGGRQACHILLEAGDFTGASVFGKSVQVEGSGSTQTRLHPRQTSIANLRSQSILLTLFGHLSAAELSLSGAVAESGGGASYYFSTGELERVEVTGNVAREGAGLYLQNADVGLRQVLFEGNLADEAGGGIWMGDSQLTLEQSTLKENVAYIQGGGGLYSLRSSGTLNNLLVVGNSALAGGGLFLQDDSVHLLHLRVEANHADTLGGGIHAVGSLASLQQAVVLSNDAQTGGGISLAQAGMTLSQVVVTRNSAAQGSGVYLKGSDLEPRLFNSILAYNTGDNLYAIEADGSPVADLALASCDLYNLEGAANHNLSPLPASNLTLEPGFVAYDAYGPTDLHLASSSALIDAGSGLDLDGSSADLGLYGGLEQAGWDVDGDGHFDWYWTGSFDAVPSGIDRSLYDRNDQDGGVY